MHVDFFVPGVPQTQGSKVGFVNPRTRKVVVKDSCKGLPDWRRKVAAIANEAMHACPICPQACMVTMAFVLPRPKSEWGKDGFIGGKKGKYNEHHIKKPDLLKMARAVEDSMSGIVYYDDSCIIEESLSKRYQAYSGEAAGVRVTVSW